MISRRRERSIFLKSSSASAQVRRCPARRASAHPSGAHTARAPTSSPARVLFPPRDMRPAGGRLPLDPATHHTSKAIFGATRGAGSVSGASIPTALLFLVALAVLLPALSFLSLHTKVLSSQRIISDHYAVRSPANPRAPLPSSPRRPVPRASNQTASLLLRPRATHPSRPPPLTRCTLPRRRWWSSPFCVKRSVKCAR